MPPTVPQPARLSELATPGPRHVWTLGCPGLHRPRLLAQTPGVSPAAGSLGVLKARVRRGQDPGLAWAGSSPAPPSSPLCATALRPALSPPWASPAPPSPQACVSQGAADPTPVTANSVRRPSGFALPPVAPASGTLWSAAPTQVHLQHQQRQQGVAGAGLTARVYNFPLLKNIIRRLKRK